MWLALPCPIFKLISLQWQLSKQSTVGTVDKLSFVLFLEERNVIICDRIKLLVKFVRFCFDYFVFAVICRTCFFTAGVN